MKMKMLMFVVILGICFLIGARIDAKEPYVIGLQSDVTGPGNVNYSPAAEGFRLYFDALNDRGGVNGHPVKVIYEDNKSNPARAGALATKMILEDNVLAMCIMSFSPSHMPVNELAKKHSVPVISPWSTPAGVWEPAKYDCREIFATGMVMHPKFDYMGYAGATVADKLFSKTNSVGVISYDTIGARIFTTWALKWSEKNGFKIVYRGDIPPGTVDASSWALKIVENKSDILISSYGGDLLTYLFPTCEKLGWTGVILAGTFTSEESLVKGLDQLKKQQEKIYRWSASIPIQDISVPGGKEIIDAVKKFGSRYSPGAQHASGWVTAGVIAEALARAGWPCSRLDLLKALERTNFDTKGLLGGAIQYSPTNHLGLQYTMGLKWDHIKKKWTDVTGWVKIDPVEVAKISDFVYEK